MKLKLFICMTFGFTMQSIDAHGGGLDSSGCHHDRKRGGYNCHRSSYTPSPSTSPRTYSPNLITPSTKKICKVTIGSEYYEFDPDNTNGINVQFKDKSGKVKISCE